MLGLAANSNLESFAGDDEDEEDIGHGKLVEKIGVEHQIAEDDLDTRHEIAEDGTEATYNRNADDEDLDHQRYAEEDAVDLDDIEKDANDGSETDVRGQDDGKVEMASDQQDRDEITCKENTADKILFENKDIVARDNLDTDVDNSTAWNEETIKEENVEAKDMKIENQVKSESNKADSNSKKSRVRKKMQGGYTPRCPICQIKISKLDKESHVSGHAVDGKFNCDLCDFSTKLPQKLRPHKIVDHEGVRYICEMCEYQGFRLCDLVIHMKKEHTDEKHICHECGFRAKTKHSLAVHVFHKHTKEPTIFKCDFEGCDFTSRMKENLTAHLRGKHAKIRYSCPICKITIPRREKQDHIQIHSDQGSFCCDVCDFKSSFINQVKIHKTVAHSGIMYDCAVEGCQYKTARKNSLRLHNENLHLKMKYPCEVCGHFATTTSNLVQHKRIKHD